MNEFKVNFVNKKKQNDHFYTGFNGTLKDAKSYYLNNEFNVGIYPTEYVIKMTSVEEV